MEVSAFKTVRAMIAVAATVLALQAGVLVTPASAQYSSSQSTQWQGVAIRRAYRSVLGRDADPGAEAYIQKVLRDHWSEADVARALRQSDEYRNKR